MSLAETIDTSCAHELVTPRTPIRLPGVPGEVYWHAKIDVVNEHLNTLEIEFPNGATDTVHFDKKAGVTILRVMDDQPIKLTPSMTRQALMHAQIISGIPLQLAIEKVTNHGR